MASPQSDCITVRKMIAQLNPEAQARVHVMAEMLRDLINVEEGGHETELAFTLVLAEMASA